MNILVFEPRRSLNYSFFVSRKREAVLEGQLEHYQVAIKDKHYLIESLEEIVSDCRRLSGERELDALAIRVPFGGEHFDHHTLVNPHVIQALEDLVLHAPLHLPQILLLIDFCRNIFPMLPIVLVFETAFFTDLPQREYLYGLDTGLVRKWDFRRYGFHGIYHEAACSSVYSQYQDKDRKNPPHILSFCLEAQPEISAVNGRRPVTITSGVTPLEGIPGQTTCGEMDSSIILTLSEKKHWSPEKINAVLTQESGLKGLVGRPITWEELFTTKQPDVRLAREMMLNRFLLASGAGVAAMGGIDHVVFSGRYAEMGAILGPWLCSRLPLRNNHSAISGEDCWTCFTESLARIIADEASVIVLSVSSMVS